MRLCRHRHNGKSRQLILDPTTVTALEEYGRHRDRLHPHPAEPSLLVSMRGTRMDIIPTERVFVRLTRAAGIQPVSDRTRPRMKDLRHYADGWVMRPAVTFPLAGAAELVWWSA